MQWWSVCWDVTAQAALKTDLSPSADTKKKMDSDEWFRSAPGGNGFAAVRQNVVVRPRGECTKIRCTIVAVRIAGSVLKERCLTRTRCGSSGSASSPPPHSVLRSKTGSPASHFRISLNPSSAPEPADSFRTQHGRQRLQRGVEFPFISRQGIYSPVCLLQTEINYRTYYNNTAR